MISVSSGAGLRSEIERDINEVIEKAEQVSAYPFLPTATLVICRRYQCHIVTHARC